MINNGRQGLMMAKCWEVANQWAPLSLNKKGPLTLKTKHAKSFGFVHFHCASWLGCHSMGPLQNRHMGLSAFMVVLSNKEETNIINRSSPIFLRHQWWTTQLMVIVVPISLLANSFVSGWSRGSMLFTHTHTVSSSFLMCWWCGSLLIIHHRQGHHIEYWCDGVWTGEMCEMVTLSGISCNIGSRLCVGTKTGWLMIKMRVRLEKEVAEGLLQIMSWQPFLTNHWNILGGVVESLLNAFLELGTQHSVQNKFRLPAVEPNIHPTMAGRWADGGKSIQEMGI